MDNQIVVSELLNQVGQLNVHDLETFFLKVQQLYAQKTAHDLAIEEQRLIRQIKMGLSATKQRRFEFLIARRDARTITTLEVYELIELTNIIEKNDVLRFKRLVKLADLKQMPLPEVMRFYNIQPIQHG